MHYANKRHATCAPSYMSRLTCEHFLSKDKLPRCYDSRRVLRGPADVRAHRLVFAKDQKEAGRIKPTLVSAAIQRGSEVQQHGNLKKKSIKKINERK